MRPTSCWPPNGHTARTVDPEATGNSDAIANLLTPLVGRLVVSDPSETRVIAEAKVTTDKVDARILAQLLQRISAAGLAAR